MDLNFLTMVCFPASMRQAQHTTKKRGTMKKVGRSKLRPRHRRHLRTRTQGKVAKEPQAEIPVDKSRKRDLKVVVIKPLVDQGRLGKPGRSHLQCCRPMLPTILHYNIRGLYSNS